MILAITGGTGFVGSRVVDLALAAGHDLRALTRRAQPERAGVTWVAGTLETPDALDRLVAGNIAGTQAVVDAASRAGVARFVHVSSIAAREPHLSVYGWSKHAAEHVVTDSGLAWTIVRPPAIYGPGDMEMRDLFRMAKLGVALLPPGGRASVIAVADIAGLLLALAAADPGRLILEADDGRPGGWSHAELIRAMGVAVGRRTVLPVALPRALLAAAAWGDHALRGTGAKLTPDRVGYLCHPDWTVDPAKRPPPALWTPQIDTAQGLAETASWYRSHRLL